MNKWIALIAISAMTSGCAVEATRHGDWMQLKGWGAKQAEWTDKDGHKFTLGKEEPLRVPDLVPLRYGGD